MSGIEERVVAVDGVRTFYRRVTGDGPPVVFVHGNPTSSADWVPFLARLDRPALAPDLPGWGYSERPRRFAYSMAGLGAFVGRFLEALDVAEHSLVVHDWGVVSLIAAQQRPELLRRLVVINGVPLLPGYRWHWVARYLWRVPVVGELANATTTRASLRLLSRQASPRPGPVPEDFIGQIADAWRGDGSGARSRPELLELYRSADPPALAAAGARLSELRCPALVVWGRDDPFLPVRFAREYAAALPDARLVELDGAGHWPWLEQGTAVDVVTAFLRDSGG
jgi:pimeloyl-ACP methyl ester carboxylesterase